MGVEYDMIKGSDLLLTLNHFLHGSRVDLTPLFFNWLDTEGRPNGLIYWRFVLPEEDVETPKAKKLPFEKLTQP